MWMQMDRHNKKEQKNPAVNFVRAAGRLSTLRRIIVAYLCFTTIQQMTPLDSGINAVIYSVPESSSSRQQGQSP